MEFLTEKCKKLFQINRLDAGAAAKIKVKPMNFTINHYDLEGAGHLVVMQGRAMMGLMKMDTVMLTPILRDAPLFSYDRIQAMGNDTYIIELYDTLLEKGLAQEYEELKAEKERLGGVPDHDLGQHWYDPMKLPASFAKKGKKCSEILDAGYQSFFDCYLEHLSKAPACDGDAKKQKTAEYVNGLFENGGPSTDAFVKGIGREAAEKIFREVIFGIG